MKEGYWKYLGTLISLHLLLVMFSACDILSKAAAGYPFLSVPFCLCYGGMIILLGIYAIGWQQIIRRIPLTTAYANRAITVVWGMIWGTVLFHETISAQKIIGACLIMAGVVVYALCSNAEGE